MMLKAIYAATVYVILCMSVSLTKIDGSWTKNFKIEDNMSWTSNYQREQLAYLGEDNEIFDITVSPHTGNVYFTYGFHHFCIIKNKKSLSKIRIEIQIFAVDVDKTLEVVYIGCKEGIKKYNEISGAITKVDEIETRIFKLFVSKNSDKIYGVAHPKWQIYQYRNSFTEQVNLNITACDGIQDCELAVDYEGNFFYTTWETRSFVTRVLLHGEQSSTIFKAGPLYSLAVDNLGRVHGTSYADRCLYHLGKDGSWSKKVACFDFRVDAMTFDTNNDPVFATTLNKVIIFKFRTNTGNKQCT